MLDPEIRECVKKRTPSIWLNYQLIKKLWDYMSIKHGKFELQGMEVEGNKERLSNLLDPTGLVNELFGCKYALSFKEKEEELLRQYGLDQRLGDDTALQTMGLSSPEPLECDTCLAEPQREDHCLSWPRGKSTETKGIIFKLKI